MAQITKINGDFNPVAVIDTDEYNNNGTVSMVAEVVGTTLTVYAISSGVSIFVGQQLLGPGIPDGVVITAFGTGTGGVGTYTLSAAASAPVGTPLVARTMFTLGKTVQMQGPKLQYFTVAGINLTYWARTVVAEVEQLSTVHIMEVVDVNTFAFATYGASAHVASAVAASLTAKTGIVVTVTPSATFSSF